MLHSLLTQLDGALKFERASAHCDIPCKIYDPSTAQIAALTVVRMMDLITELDGKALSLAEQATLSRLMAQKEEHAEAVKQEVRVIWGDYFKQPQFEAIPNAHDLVHSIMLAGSKARQGISKDDALALLDLVNQFAEAFWKTKGVETFTAECPYPPSQQVVYPKLG